MAINKAANKGNKFQNLKLDFATVKKMSMSDRIAAAKSVGTQNLMASLTPEEYARTFPKYYSDILPSVGKSLRSVSTESYDDLTKRERGLSGLNEGEDTKAGGPKKPSASPSGKDGGGSAKTTTAAKDLPEGATALLSTIAGRESGGEADPYSAINFMAKRQGLKKSGPEGSHPFAGQKGFTAAGKYQFIWTTWKETADSAGLDPNDFSPENQDRAAWHLAKKGYKGSTKGRSLEDDIKDPKNARRILDNLPAWKKVLPGVDAPRFSEKTFLKNLDKEKEERQQAAKPGEPKPSEVAASATPEEKQQSPEQKTNDERKSAEQKQDIPPEAKNIQVASLGDEKSNGAVLTPGEAATASAEPGKKTVDQMMAQADTEAQSGETYGEWKKSDPNSSIPGLTRNAETGNLETIKPTAEPASSAPAPAPVQTASSAPAPAPVQTASAAPVGKSVDQMMAEQEVAQKEADIENAKPQSQKKKITMDEALPGYKRNSETGKLEKRQDAESDFPGRDNKPTQTASAEPAMKAYTPSPESQKKMDEAAARHAKIKEELDAEGVKYQGGKSKTYLDAEGNMVSKEDAAASDAKNKGTMQQTASASGAPAMPEPGGGGDMKSPSFQRSMDRARGAEKTGEHYDEGASNIG